MHFVAVTLQFGLRRALTILVAVQNNFNPLGMQCLELIKDHDYAAVVGGVGNVERYYVQIHRNRINKQQI